MEIEKGKVKFVLFLGRLAFSPDLALSPSNSAASWTLLPDGNATECKTPASQQCGGFVFVFCFYFRLYLKNTHPVLMKTVFSCETGKKIEQDTHMFKMYFHISERRLSRVNLLPCQTEHTCHGVSLEGYLNII